MVSVETEAGQQEVFSEVEKQSEKSLTSKIVLQFSVDQFIAALAKHQMHTDFNITSIKQ